jgi:Flagellar biosynthesis regulator FlaF
MMAKTAYADPNQPTRTPRDTEYEAFARVTRRLKQASNPDAHDFPGLVSAVHDNRQLWNVLAADIALPENPLPGELRARLSYLAAFTRLHSQKILESKASVDILIEINTSIMRGLRYQGKPT